MSSESTKVAFLDSLDLIDDELEAFVPQLLNGLSELGSMPEYIVELIDKNIKSQFTYVTDFGCGKGAVLILLAQKYDIKGQGIDIVPDFIKEAVKLSEKFKVSDRISFLEEDFTKAIPTIKEQDIVIYGYDSEILGNIQSTIQILSQCLRDNGFIILEFMFRDNDPENIEGVPTELEMNEQLEQADFKLIDKIIWDRNKLKKVNKFNNEIIRNNINKLIASYPDKELLFEKYFENQIEECIEIENKYTCATLLFT